MYKVSAGAIHKVDTVYTSGKPPRKEGRSNTRDLWKTVQGGTVRAIFRLKRSLLPGLGDVNGVAQCKCLARTMVRRQVAVTLDYPAPHHAYGIAYRVYTPTRKRIISIAFGTNANNMVTCIHAWRCSLPLLNLITLSWSSQRGAEQMMHCTVLYCTLPYCCERSHTVMHNVVHCTDCPTFHGAVVDGQRGK